MCIVHDVWYDKANNHVSWCNKSHFLDDSRMMNLWTSFGLLLEYLSYFDTTFIVFYHHM